MSVQKALAQFRAQDDRELDFCYEGGEKDAIYIATTLARAWGRGLCEDEGCPHYGTDHVCVNKRELDDIRDSIEMMACLRESYGQMLKSDINEEQKETIEHALRKCDTVTRILKEKT